MQCPFQSPPPSFWHLVRSSRKSSATFDIGKRAASLRGGGIFLKINRTDILHRHDIATIRHRAYHYSYYGSKATKSLNIVVIISPKYPSPLGPDNCNVFSLAYEINYGQRNSCVTPVTVGTIVIERTISSIRKKRYLPPTSSISVEKIVEWRKTSIYLI